MFSLFKGKRRELFFMCFVIIADFIEYTVFISCDIQRVFCENGVCFSEVLAASCFQYSLVL